MPRDRLLHAGDHRLRNRVLPVIAYDTLARRAELVVLRAEDLQRMPDGQRTIVIRRSKTDRTGVRSVRYLAPNTTRIVGEWVRKAAIADGPPLSGCYVKQQCRQGIVAR